MWDDYCNLSIQDKQLCFDQLAEYIKYLRINPELRELFIEMTINCNEHCIHCGSNCGDIPSRNALTDREILRMLIDLRNDLAECKKPLPFLSITGGEPLVRAGLIDLMKKIHYLGYNWGMTSNGTLITPQIADELKAAGMHSVGLSLDGTRETHEWFRQTKGSFDTTMAGLDNLVNTGFDSVMVTTVVHKRNVNELEAIYSLLKEHHVREWRLTNIEPIGRALSNDELKLAPEEYKYMLDFMAKKQKNPDMQILFTCNHYVGLAREHVIRPWFFFCKAGLQVAAIQYDGTIGPCLDIERREDLSYGNVRTDRILKVWNERYEVFRESKAEKSGKCRECIHRKNCDGGGFHTWDFDRNEPRICMLEMIGEL